MATLNIYLPDSLKQELDSTEGVNWSAIAQDAFRQKLLQLRANVMDIGSVAERIRSTAGTNSSKYQQGVTDGKEWAAETADADEMEVVQAIDFSEIEDLHLGAANVLAQRLDTDIEVLFGEDNRCARSEAYVRGFLEGAKEVFTAVQLHR